MFLDFIKQIFRKEVPSATREKPVHFNVDDNIQVHKDEKIPKIWKGRVHTVTEETFSVDIPDLMGEFPFPFRESAHMQVSYSLEDREALFTSQILKIAWKHKPPLIMLTYPKEVEWREIKKRQHLRVPTDIPARVTPDRDGAGSEMIRISDMSSAGLSFLSKNPYPKEEILHIKILILEFPMEIMGKVMRAEKLEERSKKEEHNFDIGVQFINLNEFQKDYIAEYVAKLQRRRGV